LLEETDTCAQDSTSEWHVVALLDLSPSLCCTAELTLSCLLITARNESQNNAVPLTWSVLFQQLLSVFRVSTTTWQLQHEINPAAICNVLTTILCCSTRQSPANNGQQNITMRYQKLSSC